MTELKLSPLEQPDSLAKRAYKALYNCILAGELKLGEVYNEKELAKYLQISRTPVREALLELSTKGLVTFLPRKGIQISQFNSKDLNEIFELRKALEISSVQKVASLANSENISHLESILQEQKEHAKNQNFMDFLQKDREFHAELSQITGNKRLCNVLDELRDLIQIMGSHALIVQGRIEEVLEEHEKIVQSIAKGDTEKACLNMDIHLEKTKENAERTLFSNRS